MTMLPPPLDPQVADVAMSGPSLRFARFRSNRGTDQRARRFQSYANLGFDVDEAATLAARDDIDPAWVRETARQSRLRDLATQFSTLEGDEATERWEQMTPSQREGLQQMGVGVPDQKQGGLFGIPIIGTWAKGAVGTATTLAEGINDVTLGNAGKALGWALDKAEIAQEEVNSYYRGYQSSIRERGWLRGIFTPSRLGNESSESGMDEHGIYRPGTRREVLDLLGGDGNESLRDMVLAMSEGKDDDEMLAEMGIEVGSATYGEELAGLSALRNDPLLQSAFELAERNKMSPGRALANTLTGFDNFSDRDYTLVSGFVDGVYTMLADPTLLAGSGFKAARLSRYTRVVGTGEEAVAHIDEILGGVDTFIEARRARQAVGVINPLDHGTYFGQLRGLRLSKEQAELTLFTDHMLAGTRAGAGKEAAAVFGDDGVDAVLGQYVRLRPKNTPMVMGMKKLIDDGKVYDELSMYAHLRDSVLIDSMRAGVGRRRIMDRTPGMFIPRMSAAGTQKLQAKLVMDDVIDWSRRTTFGQKRAADVGKTLDKDPVLHLIQGGERLRARDFAKADVWLSETMRANRLEGQHVLDDYVDFTTAMRNQGFSEEAIREIIPRRLVDELGGIVVEGDTPVYALARLAVREQRVDEGEVRIITDALRNLFPDSPEDGERLVGAFNEAADRYFTAFRDGRTASYAETLLDDAALDDNVRGVLHGLDDAYRTYATRTAEANAERAAMGGLEVKVIDEDTFYKTAFAGGLFTRAVGLDADDSFAIGAVDEALDQFRREWNTTTFTMRTPQGARTKISAPDEYLGLLDEISWNAIETRFDQLDEGARLLDAKIGVVPRLARTVARPFGSLARKMPKLGYVEFGTANGVDELKRWLDLGVTGQEARRILGEFVNASTDAQRRTVLFAAQREMLRQTGILYDPAHKEWVESVLGATQQFYGGAAMLDNTATLRPMALFPQAHKAGAMRMNDGRDLMAHFQRTRFMALMSPRYGSLLAKDGATFVQRVNRWWKPMAVLSPRLILRAGLDEQLTLLATEGASSTMGRYTREWLLRAQQRRFTQAIRLEQLDVATLRASAFHRIEGDLGRLPREVVADLAEVRRTMIDDTGRLLPAGTSEERLVIDRLMADNRELIRQGVLEDSQRLWELPPDELRRAMEDADVNGLWDAEVPLFDRPAAHITASGGRLARFADGMLERLGEHMGITEGHVRAVMAMSVDPVINKQLVNDIVHVGTFTQARRALPAGDALYVDDLEELGIVTLIRDTSDGRTVIAADVNDVLGRQGFAQSLQMMQRDDFVRVVDLPIRRMELNDDARLVLADAIDQELPMLRLPEGVPVGDPFDPTVRDGALAPLVERAVRDGDKVLFARGTFTTLPEEAKALIFAELDGSIRRRADLRDLDPASLHGAHLENLRRLGVEETSPLWLDEEEFGQLMEWFIRPGVHSDKRAMLAVNDEWMRPGAAADRAMTHRVGGDDIAYTENFHQGWDRQPSILVSDGTRADGIGPGVVIRPHAPGRGQPNLHVPAGSKPVRVVAEEGDYVLPLRDLQALPPTLAHAIRGGNDDLLARIDAYGLEDVDTATLRRAFTIDTADPDSLRSFVFDLDSRLGMIAGSFDEEIYGALVDDIAETFYEVMASRGVRGFVDVPSGHLFDGDIVPLGQVIKGEGLPPDTTVTLFDAKSLTDEGVRPKIADAEFLVRDRYDDQVDDYLDLLAGKTADGNRLARERKVEFLTRSPYWQHFRGHDAAGPLNDVVTRLAPDEVILHVPRKRGVLPGAAPSADTIGAQAAMGGALAPLYGSVDPDLARRYLELIAGPDVDAWELIEVPMKRGALRGRRADAAALGEMGPGGAPLADIHPDAARFGDQLYTVSQDEVRAAPIRPDLDEEVVIVPDRAKVLEGLGERIIERGRREMGMDLEVTAESLDHWLFEMLHDADQFTAWAEHPDTWQEAAEVLLLETVDEVGVGLSAALLGDRTGRLMRIHGTKTAQRLGLPVGDVQRLADEMARTGWMPEWLTFNPNSRLSAQVTRGKRLDTAAHQFVDEFDRNMRGLAHDSHKGSPVWDLLLKVERGNFHADDVRQYHGALPKQVIRSKMKIPENRGRFWSWTDKQFERIGKGIAELSRYPMFVDEYANALNTARAGRVATKGHLAKETYFKGVFGTKYDELMLRFEQEFSAAVGASDRATLLTELDDELVATFGRFYGPLADEDVTLFKEYLGTEMMYRETERRLAMQSAVAQVTPYIDDHRVRSMFADSVDEVIPFFYATEHFVSRWARTAWHSPEGFRRLQLYYHGLQSTGRVYTDENTGEDVFEIPASGFALEMLGDILGVEEVPGVNFTGRMKDILPGMQDGLRFGAGPAIMGPLSLLRPFGDQETASFERWLGGERAEGRALWEILTPTAIQRFLPAFTGSDTDAIGMMQLLEANHPDLVPRPTFDPNTGEMIPPKAADVEAYKDRIQNGTRILHAVKGIFGLVSPASPRVEFDPDGLNAEFVGLLESGVPIDQAVGMFLQAHPDATAYTIFATGSPSGAPGSPTEAVFNHLSENEEWYRSFKMAGPWLLPYDGDAQDEFHRGAWMQMLAMGMRERKDPDEWYADLKFAEGAQTYFPSKEAKDRALADAPTPEMRAMVEQQWRGWLADWGPRHPLFMEQLMSQEGETRREDVRTELRQALVDPNLPDVDQVDIMRTLMDSWDALSVVRNDHISYSADQRRQVQADFAAWATDFTKGNPMAYAFYKRNLERDLDLPTGVL